MLPLQSEQLLLPLSLPFSSPSSCPLAFLLNYTSHVSRQSTALNQTLRFVIIFQFTSHSPVWSAPDSYKVSIIKCPGLEGNSSNQTKPNKTSKHGVYSLPKPVKLKTSSASLVPVQLLDIVCETIPKLWPISFSFGFTDSRAPEVSGPDAALWEFHCGWFTLDPAGDPTGQRKRPPPCANTSYEMKAVKPIVWFNTYPEMLVEPCGWY